MYFVKIMIYLLMYDIFQEGECAMDVPGDRLITSIYYIVCFIME